MRCLLRGTEGRQGAPASRSGTSAAGSATTTFWTSSTSKSTCTAASGEVVVQGQSTAAGRLDCCALMPQRDLLMPWRLAIDNAGLALENKGVSRRKARERVAPLFERFGLAGADYLRPAELSGGMRQRVAFLRTLVS